MIRHAQVNPGSLQENDVLALCICVLYAEISMAPIMAVFSNYFNLWRVKLVNKIRLLISLLFLTTILATTPVLAAEPGAGEPPDGWKVSAGGALIVAPAFSGAKNYSLLAVPDLRVVYKDLFFVNIRDGIGYSLVTQGGWRIGPSVTYTFRRSEKDGGSIFQISGGHKNTLVGLGDVPGTVSLGGFAEYSLKPYRVRLELHQGVTGHRGLFGEVRGSYHGVVKFAGPPLIYSFGPHVRFGDQTYTNAYWGITQEQSARSGLEQYHADAGITAYGINGFTMVPLTKAVSVSIIAGLERLAPPVANSSLVRDRGSANQAMGGVIVSYGF